MKSDITKTVGGRYEINSTGQILSPGHRIASGNGKDRDTGTVDSISGDTAVVRWDSGVTTTLPLKGDITILG